MQNKTTFEDAPFLKIEELAEILKVPKSWIYDRTRRSKWNRFPVLRVGKHMRFRLPEVLEWLRNSEENGDKLVSGN